jgi:hypothetical protein
MFKVPAVRVTPPVAPELFPLKVNVPPGAFIVVRPSYVLLPEKVVVPVPLTVTVPDVAAPFAITLPTVTFPAPPKIKARLVLVLEISMPPLNTKDPPETQDQVAVPPALITLFPKVWIAATLFVIPPAFATVISVPVKL